MNCFTSFYSVKCAKIKFLVSLKKFLVSLITIKMANNIQHSAPLSNLSTKFSKTYNYQVLYTLYSI